MAQLTIYLDNSLEAKIKETVGTMNVSLSQFVSGLIKKEFENKWTPNAKQLAGSWKSFPSLEEIRQTNGCDTPREAF